VAPDTVAKLLAHMLLRTEFSDRATEPKFRTLSSVNLTTGKAKLRMIELTKTIHQLGSMALLNVVTARWS